MLGKTNTILPRAVNVALELSLLLKSKKFAAKVCAAIKALPSHGS
jgi:hypothetical protein